jgi:hypothetical protein
MEKLIFGFFLALGITLLVLGAVNLGSLNNIKKNTNLDTPDVLKSNSENISKSSVGVLVIGVIFTVISAFGLFRHSATASLAPPAKQSFRRYYF